MGFHETRFPDDIAYGSRGGPGFNTAILKTSSKAEQRIGRWANPIRRYNARYGVRTLDQLRSVMRFYVARMGSLNGFRFKDHADFSTAADLVGAPAFTDQVIGTGDGVTTVFQLQRVYADAITPRTRKIEKPVAGTVLVGVAGVQQMSGWTVDTTTGRITFTAAPTDGQSVTGGCYFDVPVRFGEEIDDLFPISIDGFDAGEVPDILLEELVDEEPVDDEFFFGGAKDHGVIAATTAITVAQGRVHVFAPTAGQIVSLPNFTSLPPGGPYFYLVNAGSASLDVRDHLAVTVISLAPATVTTILLGVDNTSTKKWYAA